MNDLPNEVQSLILERITDFPAFCAAHFISKGWNTKIMSLRNSEW
jgi:hypothetical protein